MADDTPLEITPTLYRVELRAVEADARTGRILQYLQHLSGANGRWRLDQDTAALLASHEAMTVRRLLEIIESLERMKALHRIGEDTRGGWLF
jgi:hypothetical protein